MGGYFRGENFDALLYFSNSFLCIYPTPLDQIQNKKVPDGAGSESDLSHQGQGLGRICLPSGPVTGSESLAGLYAPLRAL